MYRRCLRWNVLGSKAELEFFTVWENIILYYARHKPKKVSNEQVAWSTYLYLGGSLFFFVNEAVKTYKYIVQFESKNNKS